MSDSELLAEATARLERLAARTTGGDWRTGGLLASRPEVVAHLADDTTVHVAGARAAGRRPRPAPGGARPGPRRPSLLTRTVNGYTL